MNISLIKNIVEKYRIFKKKVIKIFSYVKIGALKHDRKECEKFASEFLDNLYAFDKGKVLFKPTKCEKEQFRPTKSKALSYFISGDNRACDEDKGFAIQPWTKVRFENKR